MSSVCLSILDWCQVHAGVVHVGAKLGFIFDMFDVFGISKAKKGLLYFFDVGKKVPTKLDRPEIDLKLIYAQKETQRGLMQAQKTFAILPKYHKRCKTKQEIYPKSVRRFFFLRNLFP